MGQPLPHTVAYWDDPSQVIWVDLGHRQLRGVDYYFVAEDTYGGWNDPANYDQYEGKQSAAYRLHPDGTEEEIPFSVPRDAVIYEGYMLTDEQARFVGLL